MENQSKQGGSFTLGFGLGAAAGAAFAHFLGSAEGTAVQKELESELGAVKEELVKKGLLPSADMSLVEIVSHVMTNMADFVEEAETQSKKRKRPSKKTTSSLTRKTTKSKPKKFAGV